MSPTEIVPAITATRFQPEQLLEDDEIQTTIKAIDDGSDVRNLVTIAQDEFELLRQMLLRANDTASSAKSAAIRTVKVAVYVYSTMHWRSMADTWSEYLAILRKEDGDAAWNGTYAPVEISDEMWCYLHTLVPKFFADFLAGPIVLEDGAELSIEPFLDGNFAKTKELSKFLSGDAPSLANNKAAQHWAARAVQLSSRALIQEMDKAGVRRTNHRNVPLITELRSLEPRYTDPETGEIVDGDVIVVTLYLKTRSQEKLYEMQMGHHIKSTTKATPQKKGKK